MTADLLEMLVESLRKAGIPARVRADEAEGQCVRASHPRYPLSTDLYVEWADGQSWWLSEWGTPVCPADDMVGAVEYVWRLLGDAPTRGEGGGDQSIE